MATRNETVPGPLSEFEQFVQNLLKQLEDHPDAYHVDAGLVIRLTNGFADLRARILQATEARDAAKAATEAKDAVRASLEEVTRTVVRLIQADPAVTDEAKLEAGIRPHKTSRTPVPPPHTAPIGNVMATDRLEHTLSISDAATPTRRARPAGVSGCELYLCISDAAPTDPAMYRMVRFATRTPETITFDAADGGKTANYLLRWMNGKGEFGPWSQVVSATIPAV
ncbi:MAG: hypothetical protein R3C49_16015 [Planctomycetaceae bacterium]